MVLVESFRTHVRQIEDLLRGHLAERHPAEFTFTVQVPTYRPANGVDRRLARHGVDARQRDLQRCCCIEHRWKVYGDGTTVPRGRSRVLAGPPIPRQRMCTLPAQICCTESASHPTLAVRRPPLPRPHFSEDLRRVRRHLQGPQSRKSCGFETASPAREVEHQSSISPLCS